MVTKEKLINSAKELLIIKGFHDMTVDNIVDNAGLGKGSFYNYFDSKVDLISYFSVIIMSEAMDNLKKINPSNNKSDIIDKIIDVLFKYNEENREIIEAIYYSFAGSKNLSQWEDIYKELYELIEKLLFESESSENLVKSQTIVGMIDYSAEQGYIFLKENEIEIEFRKNILYQMLSKIVN